MWYRLLGFFGNNFHSSVKLEAFPCSPAQAGHDVAEKLDIPLVILGSLPLYPLLEMAGLHACNSPHDIPFESVMTCLPEKMSWTQRKILNPLMKV